MRGGTGTGTTQQHQHLQYLTKGSTVEVTSDEEGFKGVWFEATILGVTLPASKKKSVLVEYRSILADENGSEPLREFVHISFVRPVPPVEKVESLELYDVVDASYKDGWWTGVITRVLDESRYQVTFNNPPDELEFGVSELRLHKQWVKGKWVRPGKQRKRLQELGEEKGETLEKLRGLKYPTRGLECTKVMSSNAKRYHQINNESLDPIRDQKWIDAAIDGIQETKHLDGESISQKRKRGRPPKKLRGRSPKKLRGRPPKKLRGRSPKKLRGRPPKKLASTATDMEPSGDHSEDEILGPVELAIMVNEDGKEQLEVQMGHSRKRGRMRKITQTKMSNEKAVQSRIMVNEDGKEQLEVQMGHCRKRGRMRKITQTKMSNEKADQSRLAKSSNIESQAQGSVGSSGVKTVESNRIATDVGEVLAEIPCSRFDDHPLAKWFEEIQSPTSVDGLRVSPACSPKQCAEVREKPDLPMQTPVNGTPATQTETQSLPFVKNTRLWSTIESMDIFRRIPQKPHFNPLKHCKEGSCEGLAIGYMVTFLSIVERTSRLHYVDPRSTIEEILETLSELETHGFDVQLVRDRLTELLLMKDEQEKLETQVADIDNQIITLNMDKEHIDGEIEEINKQIAELQDKLSLATSRKVVKKREIDGLRSKLMDIQAGTKKAHNEFGGLVSKPL